MLEEFLSFAGASQALVKVSEISSTLEPHQQRVTDKARTGNLLLAHGMGSGKTLSALSAADAVGAPAEIFTPASLTSNFEKEVQKHQGSSFVPYKIHSVTRAAQQGHQLEPGSTMVIDEAHLARTPGTQRNKYLKSQIQRAGRVLLLTGTPTYNQPENLAPLINMVSQKNVLSENPGEFRRQFIEERKVEPGFIGRMLGMQAGNVRRLKNRSALVEAMRGKVDVFDQTKDMPGRTEQDVDVEMSPEQQRIYDYVSGTMPWLSRLKVKWNLPPSKSEAQNLNAFSAGMRQASLSPGGYTQGTTHLQSAMQSPKLQSALTSVKEKMEKDPNFRGFIYSNYKDAGMLPMAALLKREGIPYAIYHGGMSPKEKQHVVDSYNKGHIKVMLGSSAATEGLDLKGTKLIQVLEPHFNESKTEQAIARGIRYGSHNHLPEHERTVHVERYYSTPRQGMISRMFSGKDTGIDRYIRDRALEKEELSKQIRDAIEEASR